MSETRTASNPITAKLVGTISAILTQSNQFMRVGPEQGFDILGIDRELNQQ